MKKILSFLLILTLALGLISCGGGGGGAPDNPHVGKWIGVSTEMMGMEMAVEDVFTKGLTLELKNGGKVEMIADGTKASGTWSADGDNLKVKFGNDEMDATVSGSTLKLFNLMGMGLDIVLQKEGAQAAAPGPAVEPPSGAEAAEPTGEYYGKAYHRNRVNMDFLEEEMDIYGFLGPDSSGQVFLELFFKDYDEDGGNLLSLWMFQLGNRFEPKIGDEDGWIYNLYLQPYDKELLTFEVVDNSFTIHYPYYDEDEGMQMDLSLHLVKEGEPWTEPQGLAPIQESPAVVPTPEVPQEPVAESGSFGFTPGESLSGYVENRQASSGFSYPEYIEVTALLDMDSGTNELFFEVYPNDDNYVLLSMYVDLPSPQTMIPMFNVLSEEDNWIYDQYIPQSEGHYFEGRIEGDAFIIEYPYRLDGKNADVRIVLYNDDLSVSALGVTPTRVAPEMSTQGITRAGSPTDEYSVMVLLQTENVLTDFEYIEVEWDTYEFTLMPVGDPIFTQARFEPGVPLILWVDFPGTIPSRAISFKDGGGVKRYLYLGVSGKDDSIFVEEFFMP